VVPAAGVCGGHAGGDSGVSLRPVRQDLPGGAGADARTRGSGVLDLFVDGICLLAHRAGARLRRDRSVLRAPVQSARGGHAHPTVRNCRDRHRRRAEHHLALGGTPPPVDPRDFLGLHVGHGFDLVNRLASPGCAIGIALLVLAWAERNRALLAVTVGYLVTVVVPIDLGWVLTRPSPWVFLPHLVIDGGVLLLAGLGFAVAQRPAGRPGA
jgi:hypothetical protein